MLFKRLLYTTCFALGGMCACTTHQFSANNRLTLPREWKNFADFPVTSGSKDLSRWWSRFNDPTLTQLITTALAANPNLLSARASIEEAHNRLAVDAAALFPELNGSYSAGSSQTRRDGFADQDSESFSGNLRVSWEIDLYGKNRNAMEAASARLGATEENFHAVQASLTSEVAMAYTRLRVAESALGVLRRNVKARGETAELAVWRTQSGVVDALESEQAISNLEQARAAIPNLELSYGQNRNLLCRLLGKAPGELDSMLNRGEKTIPYPAASLSIGIPIDTIRQRPDVRLAGYQLLAAAATARSVSATRFPSLNLNGTLGVNALRSGKIFNPESAASSFVAGLTAPIFNAGRIRAAIGAQNAVADQALLAYNSSILFALSEVEDSLIACKRTSERLATLEKATDAADKAATLAQLRYQAGVIDILTVLDAQRALLSLEENLFNTRTTRTLAYIQLYRSLGGGWQ